MIQAGAGMTINILFGCGRRPISVFGFSAVTMSESFSRQPDSLPIADQPSEDYLATLFVISCTVRLFISFKNCGFAIKAATSPEFTALMTSGSSRIF